MEGSPVTVRIRPFDFPNGPELVIQDKMIAKRISGGRVVLGEGVVIVKGKFPETGGTLRSPVLDSPDSLMLEVHGFTSEEVAGIRGVNIVARAAAPRTTVKTIEPLKTEAKSLSELLQIANIPQAELAQRMERSQSAISRIVNSDSPNLSSLKRFVSAMGGDLQLVVTIGDDSYELELGGDEEE